jgi:hypothetical protein
MVDEIERDVSAETEWGVSENYVFVFVILIGWRRRRPRQIVLSGYALLAWLYIHGNRTLWENLEEGTVTGGWFYKRIFGGIYFGDFIEYGPTPACHLIWCEELIFS